MQNIDATGVLTQGYARMFLGSFLEESVAPERYKFTSLWNNIPVPIPRSQMKEKEPGVFRICSYYCCLVAKMCPNSCDPMDCSTPGSSVYGIFQARILEWVAISSSREGDPSRGASRAKDWTHVPQRLLHRQADSLPLNHLRIHYWKRNVYLENWLFKYSLV